MSTQYNPRLNKAMLRCPNYELPLWGNMHRGPKRMCMKYLTQEQKDKIRLMGYFHPVNSEASENCIVCHYAKCKILDSIVAIK